ncbi:MAG: hypothetical protein J07HQW1_02108, partial [Haloquadratum walsbyi J07HQW1]
DAVCLFSRSGYTADLEHVAETRDDVSLFKPADLIAPNRLS